MAGGRPPYDKMKIGRDFVEWAKNNPEALTVPMYAVSIGLHSGIMRAWAKEDEEFSALFSEAKEHIGINRFKATLETAENKLDSSIYRAHIGNYDIDLNTYIREEKQYDSSLREKEAGVVQSSYNITVNHDLAAGSKLSASGLSERDNKGSE